MGFVSILDKKVQPYADCSLSNFMVDLNLDQVVRQIQLLWPEEIEKLFYFLPKDKEVSDYRRAVYADVKQENVFACLNQFIETMRERKHAVENGEAVYHTLQKYIWFVLEVATYCDACTELCGALEKSAIASEGLTEFYRELSTYTNSDSYQQMQETASELREELGRFHVTLVYENDRIAITQERQPGTYDDFLNRAFGERNDILRSPFKRSMNLTNFEQEIVNVFQKNNAGFVSKAKKFSDQYKNYAKEWILNFSDEILFYLSYHQFRKVMEDGGFAFAEPSVDETEAMKASGLYDLALAIVNQSQGKEVVSNELQYYEGEQFFVLTGPNQGGKTTFARSLGQLVYFTKMGLDVPALHANVHHFTRILTHFSVEESVETGRGKLKEELVRLRPMMAEESDGAFVIINELFTTAANYDACLMGKKVLSRFISEQCHGIYVTHLKELAEEGNGVVSLCAMLDEQRMQNFKIIRKPADDTACAQNQVNKYQLSYDQLKKRLDKQAHGNGEER